MSKKPKNLKNNGQQHSKTKKKSKIPTIVLVIVLLLIAAGVGVVFWLSTMKGENHEFSRVEFDDPIYSILTGEEISDASLNSSPTFCIQVPNGSTDGARPQAGLSQAGVVFEAIAETGITRLAAVFQNPTVSAIGPVRSLRPYYLDWDTPFDCTVVHAGGSDEAIAAINRGGQRNLDENYAYMWREDGSGRLWNNLFTSPDFLLRFNNDHGYSKSSPKAFPRLTPEAVEQLLASRQSSAECTDDTECPDPADLASEIIINFSNSPSHNTRYIYDPATNSYLRYHQDGQPHTSYNCSADLEQPNSKTDCGAPAQLAPKALAVMRVQENTMSDNYHENIKTIGNGNAYIFQNGEVIEGSWSKTSQDSQIVFRDDTGEVISFTPGQLWISAVPQFGSVRWN